MNKRAATWKQQNNWNFFQQKISHIISLKVTKFQQPLLITLGVADEKPEEGQKAPPPRDIGLSLQKILSFSGGRGPTAWSTSTHWCKLSSSNNPFSNLVLTADEEFSLKVVHFSTLPPARSEKWPPE